MKNNSVDNQHTDNFVFQNVFTEEVFFTDFFDKFNYKNCTAFYFTGSTFNCRNFYKPSIHLFSPSEV